VDSFFDEPQGAAKLKHEVLRQHLAVYARTTGSRTPVVLLDGYAGPGQYEEGSPGSPRLMVDTAKAMQNRDIHCIFVERDRHHWQQLQGLLIELGDEDSEPLYGRLEERLDEVLVKAAGKSLFVFLDPFGLAIPFAMLCATLRRRPRYGPRGVFQPTEVILNFSISGLNRAAGRLDSQADSPTVAKMHQTRLEELEAFLGGPWWQTIWQQSSTDRVQRILDEYLRRFRTAFPRWKTLTVPVADSWDGPPSYYLVLLTEHDLGLWVFANAVSYGAKVLQEHTFADRPRLFPPEVEENWPATIGRNVLAILARRGSFRVVDELRDVYGKTLGRAGQSHVLKALKDLAATGQIAGTPTSRQLYKFVVSRPRRS
jgi:three-Cys-motif partner protein